MSPRRLIALLAPLAAVLAGAFFLSFFRIASPDTFWHLKTGQVMLETGRLVDTNLFSSTYPDHHFHNWNWLFQTILGLAYNPGGWPGVAALKILLVAAMAALLYLLLVSSAGRPLAAAALVLVSLSVIRCRLTERPHLFSYLLFVVFMLVADRHLRRGGRVVWLLPPLAAVWNNVHPEVIIGMLYLAGTLTGLLLARAREDAPDRERVRQLALSALLCLPASLLNPEGYRGMIYPLLKTEFLPLSAGIGEYASTTFARFPFFWLLLGAAALLAILSRRRDWSAILPLAGLALIGALYMRSLAYFSLAAAPFVHRRLAELAAARGRRAGRALTAAAILAALAAFTWAMRYDRVLSYRAGFGPDTEYSPVAAADFVASKDLPPNLFHDYTEGGYLIFRLYPRMKVFQDGRGPSAYPDDFLLRLGPGNLKTDWPALYREFGVNTALFPTPDVPLFFRPQEWGVVYWDDRFTVLVRRSPDNQPILDRYEYRYYLPGGGYGGDDVPAAALLGEVERNLSERASPDWAAFRNAGVVLGRFRLYGNAEPLLRKAASLNPKDAETLAYLGRALEMNGRPDEAEAAYRRSLDIDPGQVRVARWLRELEARIR